MCHEDTAVISNLTLYLIVYCCFVAKLPKPDPPAVYANGSTTARVEIVVPALTGITMSIKCMIKYKKQGDVEWHMVQVSNCASITISNLQQNSHYIFIFELMYTDHKDGSESDQVTVHIKDRKCLMTLLNALLLR